VLLNNLQKYERKCFIVYAWESPAEQVKGGFILPGKFENAQ
jgi:hypothetical protein